MEENIYYKNENVIKVCKELSFIYHDDNNKELKETEEFKQILKLWQRLEQRYNNYDTRFKK